MITKVQKTKWIKALESGKFKKVVGQLKSDYDHKPRYCCLGVACEIGIASPNRNPSSHSYYCSAKFLPIKVQKDLASKNDGGWSFKRIANYIKKHL